jgi:cytochrome c oxidase subunit II
MHRPRVPPSDRATPRAAQLPGIGARWLAPAALTWLAGCRGPQSALDPQGPQAAGIAESWWVMLIGATVVFVIVSALVLYAIYRDPARRPAIAPQALVVGGGLVFPLVVLVALLVYGTLLGIDLLREPAEPVRRIDVTGQQFWWQVDYGDDGPVTANELYLPVGQPVELALRSRDVIHSFWVPSLAGKVDLIPGRTNALRLRADRPGVFLGQCAEFCGLLHAHMRLVVVALEPDAFEAWRRRRAQPADPAVLAARQPALQAFDALGCAGCHAIRGSAAAGSGGPDLTHFGARVDPQQVVTPAGRPQLALWLQQRHAPELRRRQGEQAAPDAEQAEALAHMLEALQ